MMLDTTTGDRGMPIDVSGPLAANALDCGRYSPPRWRVIVTSPRAEALARDSIQAIDIAAFLPMVARPLRGHSVLQPLFPGYLFALIDTDAPSWGNVFRARGVEDVLRAPGSTTPASVPASRVEAIMAHCSARQVVEDDPRPHLIAAGVSVQITTGMWADHRGVCQWSSHDRVALLLDVMGLQVNVARRAVREA